MPSVGILLNTRSVLRSINKIITKLINAATYLIYERFYGGRKECLKINIERVIIASLACQQMHYVIFGGQQ